MSCITHSVVLHACLKRSQILLPFNMHQVMYSIFCIVPYLEVACKGLFFIQHSQEQGQTLVSEITISIVLDLCFVSESIVIALIPLP